MIDVVLLGTAGSSPTKSRGMPSVALTYNGELFLFDCGEGTQMQMLKYKINSYKLKAIFVSHTHGDHIIGIAGLIRSLALNNRTAELKIFVPRGYEKIVHSLVVFDKAIIGYSISIIGISSGTVYKGKGFRIEAFKLNHTVSTYGYVFREDDKVRFIKDKSKALGLKGIMFAELEEDGHIKVKGRTIHLRNVTIKQKGKVIAYASDTRPVTSTLIASRNADLLIHESSYANNNIKLARQRKHSTALEVATLAKKAHVKLLVLIHFSARYKTTNALLSEAKTVFGNTVVGKDGYKIQL